MTSKIKNKTDNNLWKNKGRKLFSITEMMDLRSFHAAFSQMSSYEPEPLFIKGQYLYV